MSAEQITALTNNIAVAIDRLCEVRDEQKEGGSGWCDVDAARDELGEAIAAALRALAGEAVSRG
jgi:hypothetical protein